MRMKKAAVTLALTLGFASTAFGQADWVYVSSEGHQYQYSQNADGAVLKSLYPVARFQGTGAMTEVITGIETLYLGRDCDAFTKIHGQGSWAWANGGFTIEFDGHRIGFPRQEIDASNNGNCQMR